MANDNFDDMFDDEPTQDNVDQAITRKPAHSPPLHNTVQMLSKSVATLSRTVGKLSVSAAKMAVNPAKDYVGEIKEDINEKPTSAANIIGSEFGGSLVGYLAGTAVDSLTPYLKQSLSSLKYSLGSKLSSMYHSMLSKHKASSGFNLEEYDTGSSVAFSKKAPSSSSYSLDDTGSKPTPSLSSIKTPSSPSSQSIAEWATTSASNNRNNTLGIQAMQQDIRAIRNMMAGTHNIPGYTMTTISKLNGSPTSQINIVENAVKTSQKKQGTLTPTSVTNLNSSIGSLNATSGPDIGDILVALDKIDKQLDLLRISQSRQAFDFSAAFQTSLFQFVKNAPLFKQIQSVTSYSLAAFKGLTKFFIGARTSPYKRFIPNSGPLQERTYTVTSMIYFTLEEMGHILLEIKGGLEAALNTKFPKVANTPLAYTRVTIPKATEVIDKMKQKGRTGLASILEKMQRYMLSKSNKLNENYEWVPTLKELKTLKPVHIHSAEPAIDEAMKTVAGIALTLLHNKDISKDALKDIREVVNAQLRALHPTSTNKNKKQTILSRLTSVFKREQSKEGKEGAAISSIALVHAITESALYGKAHKWAKEKGIIDKANQAKKYATSKYETAYNWAEKKGYIEKANKAKEYALNKYSGVYSWAEKKGVFEKANQAKKYALNKYETAYNWAEKKGYIEKANKTKEYLAQQYTGVSSWWNKAKKLTDEEKKKKYPILAAVRNRAGEVKGWAQNKGTQLLEGITKSKVGKKVLPHIVRLGEKVKLKTGTTFINLLPGKKQKVKKHGDGAILTMLGSLFGVLGTGLLAAQGLISTAFSTAVAPFLGVVAGLLTGGIKIFVSKLGKFIVDFFKDNKLIRWAGRLIGKGGEEVAEHGGALAEHGGKLGLIAGLGYGASKLFKLDKLTEMVKGSKTIGKIGARVGEFKGAIKASKLGTKVSELSGMAKEGWLGKIGEMMHLGGKAEEGAEALSLGGKALRIAGLGGKVLKFMALPDNPVGLGIMALMGALTAASEKESTRTLANFKKAGWLTKLWDMTIWEPVPLLGALLRKKVIDKVINWFGGGKKKKAAGAVNKTVNFLGKHKSAIIAGAAITQALSKRGLIKDFIEGTESVGKTILSGIWDSEKKEPGALFKTLYKIGKTQIGKLKGFGKNIWKTIAGIGHSIVNMFWDTVHSKPGRILMDFIKKPGQFLANLSHNIGSTFNSAIKGIFQIIIGPFWDVKTQSPGWLFKTGKAIWNLGKWTYRWIKNTVTSFGKWIINLFWNVDKSEPGKLFIGFVTNPAKYLGIIGKFVLSKTVAAIKGVTKLIIGPFWNVDKNKLGWLFTSMSWMGKNLWNMTKWVGGFLIKAVKEVAYLTFTALWDFRKNKLGWLLKGVWTGIKDFGKIERWIIVKTFKLFEVLANFAISPFWNFRTNSIGWLFTGTKYLATTMVKLGKWFGNIGFKIIEGLTSHIISLFWDIKKNGPGFITKVGTKLVTSSVAIVKWVGVTTYKVAVGLGKGLISLFWNVDKNEPGLIFKGIWKLGTGFTNIFKAIGMFASKTIMGIGKFILGAFWNIDKGQMGWLVNLGWKIIVGGATLVKWIGIGIYKTILGLGKFILGAFWNVDKKELGWLVKFGFWSIEKTGAFLKWMGLRIWGAMKGIAEHFIGLFWHIGGKKSGPGAILKLGKFVYDANKWVLKKVLSVFLWNVDKHELGTIPRIIFKLFTSKKLGNFIDGFIEKFFNSRMSHFFQSMFGIGSILSYRHMTQKHAEEVWQSFMKEGLFHKILSVFFNPSVAAAAVKHYGHGSISMGLIEMFLSPLWDFHKNSIGWLIGSIYGTIKRDIENGSLVSLGLDIVKFMLSPLVEFSGGKVQPGWVLRGLWAVDKTIYKVVKWAVVGIFDIIISPFWNIHQNKPGWAIAGALDILYKIPGVGWLMRHAGYNPQTALSSKTIQQPNVEQKAMQQLSNMAKTKAVARFSKETEQHMQNLVKSVHVLVKQNHELMNHLKNEKSVILNHMPQVSSSTSINNTNNAGQSSPQIIDSRVHTIASGAH